MSQSHRTWMPTICSDASSVPGKILMRLDGFRRVWIDDLVPQWLCPAGWTRDRTAAYDFTGGGSVGPVGPAGPAGAAGPSGAAGSPGAVGATGSAGAPGSAGATGLTGATGAVGLTGAVGSTGATGTAGAVGATGPSGVNAFGSPTSRSISLATAFQATTPTKPAIVTVNLSSSAGLSLAVGTTNTADIVIGATSAVAAGTGTVVGKYANSLTGTLVIGLAINTASAAPVVFALPIGWFFAIRQTAGTVSITSAFDQAVG